MVTLTEITFSEALSFSIMGERRRFLFHTETTKLQPNNFFPKCVDYNMHLKWDIWAISCPESFDFSDR